MYKNVSLRKRTQDGRPTWTLVGPDGHTIAAFDAFAASLRNAPPNTRNSYCRHVAEFIDYLLEVSAIRAQDRQLTKMELTEAIEAYPDYLRWGQDASKDVARAVAARLPPGANAAASLLPKKAAVRRFLELSEEVRKEIAEISRMQGRAGLPVASEPALAGASRRRKLQPHEVLAMQGNSMLAGVIAGGPKFVKAIVINDRESSIPYDVERAFPFDKVLDLIDAMPTYRDKAQYALLAACGCRTHEALQVLMEDLDVVEGTLRLVDPGLRPGHRSYRALSTEDRASLAWKGRTTQLTMLIEPFASTFFETLQVYLAREQIAHGRHDFLFQYHKGNERGQPYFLSKASTRLETFQKACKRVGVELPRGTGPHSLRHMYGTYLLNYFPRSNGDYGLPVPMIQQLMGHASPKSTLKYARYDQDLLKREIENANRVLFMNGTPKKLLEIKLQALEFQVAKVRLRLSQEARGND